jgi:hypothetical protein
MTSEIYNIIFKLIEQALWPLVIVIIFLILKKAGIFLAISAMIDRVKKFSFKDFNLSLAEEKGPMNDHDPLFKFSERPLVVKQEKNIKKQIENYVQESDVSLNKIIDILVHRLAFLYVEVLLIDRKHIGRQPETRHLLLFLNQKETPCSEEELKRFYKEKIIKEEYLEEDFEKTISRLLKNHLVSLVENHDISNRKYIISELGEEFLHFLITNRYEL